jgi:transcriptional regulator with XRE-family HTH domain
MYVNFIGHYIHTGEKMSRASGSASFGELLDYLFATKLKPDGTRYKLREVADATGISIGFLSEARHGNKENPPKEFIELLADFFDVPPAYFFGPLPESAATLEAALQEALVKPSMGQILLRAGAYSDVEREMLLDLMDSVERVMDKVKHTQRKDNRPD